MPSRSELPGSLKPRKFLRALTRCGFLVDARGGKGSHVKIMWPATQKSVTVTRRLDRDVLHYLLKEIEGISGVTWDDILANL